MHAIVRINTFDEARLSAAAGDVGEFDELHSRQPGYAGRVVVDLGGGRRLGVNLWESAEHAQAALAVLRAEVDRRLGPLMAAPSEFVGAGPASVDIGHAAPDRRDAVGSAPEMT